MKFSVNGWIWKDNALCRNSKYTCQRKPGLWPEEKTVSPKNLMQRLTKNSLNDYNTLRLNMRFKAKSI